MIAVVLGMASTAAIPERRMGVIHELATSWPGPACNQGVDPAVRLIGGQLVDAERITCWACRTAGGVR